MRRPSSKRIAARTESPSWTRAARREGCGWGKWVISSTELSHDPLLSNRLLKPLVRIPHCEPELDASRPCVMKRVSGVLPLVNVL